MASGRPQEAPLHIIDLGGGREVALLDLLGKGGFAKVYRGLLTSQHGVRKMVAVKLFSAVSSEEAEQVFDLLSQTARRVACIDHPNVVRIYECGVWRGQPFLVMELVNGITLAKFHEVYCARQRRIPLDIGLFIACEIADALAGARIARDHDGFQLNLVHHGVGAREVLLSWRGEVKLSDFESSTARAASSAVRSLRGVANRANAMAPEVASGQIADARSDVFSVGVLLRELFVGPRFPAGLSNADAIRLAREGYVQPITFQPHLPEGLVGVMLRALEPHPDNRYPHAGALAYDLRRVALAMGVGDGRYFLKSTLEREWAEHAEEITSERAMPDAYEGAAAVVEITARTSGQERLSRKRRK